MTLAIKWYEETGEATSGCFLSLALKTNNLPTPSSVHQSMFGVLLRCLPGCLAQPNGSPTAQDVLDLAQIRSEYVGESDLTWFANVITGDIPLPSNMRRHNFCNQKGGQRSYDEILTMLINADKQMNNKLCTLIQKWRTNPNYDPLIDPNDNLFTTLTTVAAAESNNVVYEPTLSMEKAYCVYAWRTTNGTLHDFESRLHRWEQDGNANPKFLSQLKKFICLCKASKTLNNYNDNQIYVFKYIGETTQGFGKRAPQHIEHPNRPHGGSIIFSGLADHWLKKDKQILQGAVVFNIEVNDVQSSEYCHDMIKFVEAAIATLSGRG